MSEPTIVEKPKVLIIDDELGLREMLVFGLSERGYDVDTVGSGEEGLARIKDHPVDMVVCDIMMPGLGGVETLKEIKKICPDTEVIMATGYATLETAVESMKQGAYDYIPKPYGLDQLGAIFEKALERRRLKAQVGHLEELNRLKSEFLASMSHELRTPMNAIIGYTSLLMEGIYGPLSEKQDQSLKRIETNAKNLLQLINNILDLSKLSAGRMPVYLESCSIQELAREVLETMESLARDRKLDLRLEAPEDLLLKTDKTKLKQILINLVGNAIKFTHEGAVILKVERLPMPERIQISVRDTGIGIRKEDIPSLFQEFKQLDSSPTREYGGSGLGLSICRKIIEILGGTIAVESEVGRGSTFKVLLPIGEVQDHENAAPAPAPVEVIPQKVVLSIDDDPEVLNLLTDSLKGTGYTCVGAQSGDEGIAMARQLHPHLITLDIMMPHRDGWSVLQSLKSDPELRHIPVVIVSIIENKALGFSLGVSDYIVKPFERKDLLERLRRLENGVLKKVLVVDDDPGIARLLQESLKQEGYSVEVADNGREALLRLSQNPPDVMFLDLMMPGASGFDVLEAMSKNPACKFTRVFVMTAKHLTPKETEYLEQRVEMIVQKSARNLQEILGMIKSKLNEIKEVSVP